MSEALGYFYDIYTAFISFIFGSNAEFIPGVSIGWFFVSCFVFTVLLKNIINLPKRSLSIKVGGSSHGSDDNN